jgi:hypothetical protein
MPYGPTVFTPTTASSSAEDDAHDPVGAHHDRVRTEPAVPLAMPRARCTGAY